MLRTLIAETWDVLLANRGGGAQERAQERGHCDHPQGATLHLERFVCLVCSGRNMCIPFADEESLELHVLSRTKLQLLSDGMARCGKEFIYVTSI